MPPHKQYGFIFLIPRAFSDDPFSKGRGRSSVYAASIMNWKIHDTPPAQNCPKFSASIGANLHHWQETRTWIYCEPQESLSIFQVYFFTFFFRILIDFNWFQFTLIWFNSFFNWNVLIWLMGLQFRWKLNQNNLRIRNSFGPGPV